MGEYKPLIVASRGYTTFWNEKNLTWKAKKLEWGSHHSSPQGRRAEPYCRLLHPSPIPRSPPPSPPPNPIVGKATHPQGGGGGSPCVCSTTPYLSYALSGLARWIPIDLRSYHQRIRRLYVQVYLEADNTAWHLHAQWPAHVQQA